MTRLMGFMLLAGCTLEYVVPAEYAAGVEAGCPADLARSLAAQGGACLEPEVLGAEAVAACGAWLEGAGFARDADAERFIGAQTGKRLVCFAGR